MRRNQRATKKPAGDADGLTCDDDEVADICTSMPIYSARNFSNNATRLSTLSLA
jgi:hypothetical protein